MIEGIINDILNIIRIYTDDKGGTTYHLKLKQLKLDIENRKFVFNGDYFTIEIKAGPKAVKTIYERKQDNDLPE